jgi:hypothetical protein
MDASFLLVLDGTGEDLQRSRTGPGWFVPTIQALPGGSGVTHTV